MAVSQQQPMDVAVGYLVSKYSPKDKWQGQAKTWRRHTEVGAPAKRDLAV
jgi:hypothetical protein